ncbi:hypothetical protein ACFQO7_33715 [Catellatospora aurea]|uniref:Uncharacterized protein n=1 Tax=Catellatospora aurea TaxID=1337874 RepID=A0ABW2H5E5_9ACTN
MDIRYTRRHILGRAAAPDAAPADRAAARAILILQLAVLACTALLVALAAD